MRESTGSASKPSGVFKAIEKLGGRAHVIVKICGSKEESRALRKSKKPREAHVMSNGCIIPPQVRDEAQNHFKFDAGRFVQ